MRNCQNPQWGGFAGLLMIRLDPGGAGRCCNDDGLPYLAESEARAKQSVRFGDVGEVICLIDHTNAPRFFASRHSKAREAGTRSNVQLKCPLTRIWWGKADLHVHGECTLFIIVGTGD